MGKYTRELNPAPSIDGDSLVPVSEETTDDLYKSTVLNFGKNQETSVCKNVGNHSSVGTLSTGASTTELVLSNSTDYDNLTIGTVITVEGDLQHVEQKVSPNKVIVFPDTGETRSNVAFNYSYPFWGNVLSTGETAGYSNKNLTRLKTDLDLAGIVSANDLISQSLTSNTVIADDITATTSLSSTGTFNTSDINCSYLKADNKITAKKIVQEGSGDSLRFMDMNEQNETFRIANDGVISTFTNPAWFLTLTQPFPFSNTFGKIRWTSADFDRGTNFSSARGTVWQLPEGLYYVKAAVLFETSSWSPGDNLRILISYRFSPPAGRGQAIGSIKSFEDPINDYVTITVSGVTFVDYSLGQGELVVWLTLPDIGRVVNANPLFTYFCGYRVA